MSNQSNKLRRQKINIMLNEDERRIITEKAIQYGFGDCLAEYVRAAAIYENIYIEDIEGKNEVCDAVSKFIEMLREILKEQQKILKNKLLSPNDINLIYKQNNIIIEKINSLSRLLVSLLSVNTEEKIQRRKNVLEKYKFNAKFLEKIIKKERGILIVRPSNLHKPNQKIGFIVFLTNYNYTFDLSNIDCEQLFNLVNHFRDVAMQKRLLISFVKENNYLRVGIVMDFDDFELAKEYVLATDADAVITLLDEHGMIGEINANNS